MSSVTPSAVKPHVRPVTENILRSEAEPNDASFVIFGASGDLTARKLLPALYDLWQDGYLSDRAPIVGVARREMTDDQFREEMRAAVNEEARTAPVSADDWDRFAARLHYRRLDIAAPDQYEAWGEAVRDIERAAGVEEKRVAYLAVGPNLFHDCVAALAGGGLIPEDDNDAEPPWLRVVVEKPFGTDLESARELNADLRATLRETQLYRIDHYLGKETVQNVLMFRFGNGIFEPLFNRQHVDHVQITVSESRASRAAAAGITTKAAPCGTCCRTTSCNYSPWWRWSRPRSSPRTTSGTKNARCSKPSAPAGTPSTTGPSPASTSPRAIKKVTCRKTESGRTARRRRSRR